MLNAEKYKERIKELDYRFALRNGKLKSCKGNRCDECTFYEGSCSCMKFINQWLLEEYKEPILTEEDKKILKDVINVFNSFKKEIVDIRKRHICRGCYLYINYIDGGEDVSSIETHTTLPFNGDKLFKGMKLDKRYTLEELEL